VAIGIGVNWCMFAYYTREPGDIVHN